MRVADLMKRKPLFVTPHDTCQTAARRMRDANVGFLPVCDWEHRVIGAVTDRDLALRIVAEGLESGLPAVDVMSHEVVACHPDDDLERAEEMMGSSHKSRLVVVDDFGRLAGVLSLSDIAEHDVSNAGATIRRIAEREVQPEPGLHPI